MAKMSTCAAAVATLPPPTPSFIPSPHNPCLLLPRPPLLHSVIRLTTTKSSVNNVAAVEEEDALSAAVTAVIPMTGSAYDFEGATTSLSGELLSSAKRIALVRHGLSSWNQENRVQGSSNSSVLTEIGAKQARKCRHALRNMNFDVCFSSPISRAKSTAELMWIGNPKPLVFLESLKEAHLFFLEGMTNADAKKKYPELYTKWREDPSNFHVNSVYPIRRLWETAQEAWKQILSTQGEDFLVVTHKSILRALICTALGLGPERFRSIEVNNGGISVFSFNRRGEAMLQSLNMTAHMYSDHVYEL